MDVFGSPPMEKRDGSFVIGGRPLTITKKDKIIVMNISSDALASSYYGTPALYFSNLQKKIHLDLEYVTITGYNQMKKIIKEAEDKKSRFIAVRVYNKEDYEPVRSWLEKDNQNKAILFHSMAYPYGYKLFMEFPEQTSFGDLNPIIT